MNTSMDAKDRHLLLEIVLSNTYVRQIKVKALVVILCAYGLTYKAVSGIIGICDKSARKYVNQYRENGLEWLITVNNYKPKSELEDYKEQIIDELEKKPCATINECRSRIKNLTGIERCPTQIREFLKKCEFKHLKAGQFPAKADPEKQKEFLKNDLEPRLEEAKKGTRVLFFGDAAHFVMGAFLTNLWCRVRVYICTSSGRQRYNVLGALNPFTQELITVTNNGYINADSVCELLQKLYDKCSVLRVPMSLVLDNAKYQKCEKVTLKASELGIEILYLPTYSPNLNLIERLWKFVKKDCLYAEHYTKFADFKFAIDQCLSEINGKHKESIQKLITTNFQDFSKIKKFEKAA
jgi:transposase